jgi:hypothetical protein
MRGLHILFHPLLHCGGGDLDAPADQHLGQFASLNHAPDGPSGNTAELAGGFLQAKQ